MLNKILKYEELYRLFIWDKAAKKKMILLTNKDARDGYL